MGDPAPVIPPYLTPAARAEKLIPAAVALLAMICFLVVSALAAAAWPMAFSDTRWRFRNASLLLAAEPQIALVLTIISVAGVYAGIHRAVRCAAVALLTGGC